MYKFVCVYSCVGRYVHAHVGSIQICVYAVDCCALKARDQLRCSSSEAIHVVLRPRISQGNGALRLGSVDLLESFSVFFSLPFWHMDYKYLPPPFAF